MITLPPRLYMMCCHSVDQSYVLCMLHKVGIVPFQGAQCALVAAWAEGRVAGVRGGSH
jgi:hypothetical protein